MSSNTHSFYLFRSFFFVVCLSIVQMVNYLPAECFNKEPQLTAYECFDKFTKKKFS